MKDPIRILFVCHGNICRSPMAEYVFKDMVKKRGLESRFEIASAATSTEELGEPVHHGTARILRREGIDYHGHHARQITKRDYGSFDFLIGMDDRNVRNMRRVWNDDPNGKVYKFMEFAGSDADVADPWYTGNFDVTYDDVVAGCTALLGYLGF